MWEESKTLFNKGKHGKKIHPIYSHIGILNHVQSDLNFEYEDRTEDFEAYVHKLCC